jgi:hypothetical protein
VDVTTGSPGVTLMGDSLSTWKENLIPYRGKGGDDQRHSAVWLGWNNHVAGKDTTKFGRPASYTVTISDSLRSAMAPSGASAIYLSLAVTKDKPGPRRGPRDTTKADTSAEGKKRARAVEDSLAKDSTSKAEAKKKEVPDTTPVEITIELTDAGGRSVRMPLGRYGTIRRPLESYIYRRDGRDESRFNTLFEIVPQTFVVPLRDFAQGSAGFDPAALKSVRLLFDKTAAGTVIVSDIGISPRIDPIFIGAPIP